MASVDDVTIALPPAMAEILRDVCNEWIEDHARFSTAAKKMTGMFLSVILQQIDEQIKEKAPQPETIEGHVCGTCHQSFTTLRGLKGHKGRMKH